MAEANRRTDIDFEEYRKRLTEERGRLLGLHQLQRADIIEENRDSSENELGSFSTFDSAENEDTAAVLADMEREEAADYNVRELLAQVEHALNRLDDGSYGLSEVSGKPIPIARLRAVPWATMTVEEADRVV